MRLIDLHCDWLLQYAGESTLFDPPGSPRAARSNAVSQSDGYLGATSAAFVSCYRDVADWRGRGDPWSALGDLIARIEAEFSGRLLRDPVDLERWDLDVASGGLAWGVIAVEGFDFLIREDADLDHLPALLRRGVRLFQPTYGESSVLAGSSAPGDDRGLLPLGARFLETLAAASEPTRPIIDLAHLNPTAASEVLDWLEAHPGRLIPVYSHGALAYPGFATPRAITLDNLGRLRALGGTVGFSVSPPFYRDPADLQAGIRAAAELPFQGRPGFEGIAVGTDFLGVDATLPGLANAGEVVAWVEAAFSKPEAAAIVHGNARRLVEQMLGSTPSP